MTQWYYSDYERNRHGPVSAGDLAELHANGQLAPDTLVWREGLSQWQPWRTLVGEVIQGSRTPGRRQRQLRHRLGRRARRSRRQPLFRRRTRYRRTRRRAPPARCR